MVRLAGPVAVILSMIHGVFMGHDIRPPPDRTPTVLRADRDDGSVDDDRPSAARPERDQGDR